MRRPRVLAAPVQDPQAGEEQRRRNGHGRAGGRRRDVCALRGLVDREGQARSHRRRGGEDEVVAVAPDECLAKRAELVRLLMSGNGGRKIHTRKPDHTPRAERVAWAVEPDPLFLFWSSGVLIAS